MAFDRRRTLADWLARTTDLPDPIEVAAVLAGAPDGLSLHHALDPDLDLAAVLAPLRHLLDGDTP